MVSIDNKDKIARWYFGGLAAAAAACVTHPLDLLKVQLQTQKGKNVAMLTVAKRVIREQGVLGLYNGISASLLRQFTYSMARFGFYETAKQAVIKSDSKNLPLLTSMVLAGFGGLAGGLVGNPADLVNVRMQNDIKLPKEHRRNYRNAFHGIYRVCVKEGPRQLWAGSTMNCCRATLMTMGQITFYEQTKAILLKLSYFEDNVLTHMVASSAAGVVATALCQPFDVLKTRSMNAKKGEIKSVKSLLLGTVAEGPLALYKGFFPALARIAPHTIFTFIFLEQLRLHFGYIKAQPHTVDIQV